MTPEKMLTPQEVADILRIHPSTVIRKTRAGMIPALNLGQAQSEFRYLPSEIEELQLERNFKYRVRMSA